MKITSTFRATSHLPNRISRSPLYLSSTQSSIFRRSAHQGYGGRESGHEASDEPNPSSATHEHPGPPSPAESSNQKKDSKESSAKIHKPPEPDETKSEEVRRHNEELRKSHDAPVEKSKDEEVVDKKFWKENTGQA